MGGVRCHWPQDVLDGFIPERDWNLDACVRARVCARVRVYARACDSVRVRACAEAGEEGEGGT